MPKVRIEKHQVARLREIWNTSGQKTINNRPKMTHSLRDECKRKFDDLGKQIFLRMLQRVDVIEDSVETENVEYEPEDVALAARAEKLHRTLGEVVSRVATHRNEVPEQVQQHFKRQLQENQPRLESMPDERGTQVVGPSTDLTATLQALDRQLHTLDQSLHNVKNTLPVVLERATRVVKVIEEEKKKQQQQQKRI